MIYPQIQCYHPEAILKPHTFYVLSKGANAGKPSFKPWQNCFVVVCSNEQLFNFYFWLVYGLWQTGKFKVVQRGSAIQFINRSDIQILIREIAPCIYNHWQQFQQLIVFMNRLQQKKVSLAEQIVAAEKLQHQLLQLYFTSQKK